MTLTKKTKKILLIAVPAAVVVIGAAVLAAVLLRPNPQPAWHLQNISEFNSTGETEYTVANGLESNAELPQPMPFYSFTPPEGYTQVVNARETANRFSTQYYDEYQDSNREIISLTQQPAYVAWTYTDEGTFQEVQFGDTLVVCRMGEEDSTAIWIHGQTLLTLFVTQPLTENQLLDLVSRVDYENLSQPIYSSWEFRPGRYLEAVIDGVLQTKDVPYQIAGNPQLPEQLQYYGFASAPQGLALDGRRTDLNSKDGLRMEFYTGEQASLCVCSTMVGQQVFGDIHGKDLNDRSLVQEITVQGNQGWYHQSDTGAELVFVTDYLIVDMTYQGQITQEQMQALAESLVEKPGEEVSLQTE